MYKIKKVYVLFVPYARPQLQVDLYEILLMASLYPTDGHGKIASSTQALFAPSICRCKCYWASPGKSEVAGLETSTIGMRCKGWSAPDHNKPLTDW